MLSNFHVNVVEMSHSLDESHVLSYRYCHILPDIGHISGKVDRNEIFFLFDLQKFNADFA